MNALPDDFNNGKAKKLAELTNIPVNKSGIQIFPNPGKGKFDLLIDNEYEGKLFIQIKDLSGKTIKQYYTDKAESFYLEEMDLSKFGKGVYFIEINFNDNKESVKVLIEWWIVRLEPGNLKLEIFIIPIIC